MSEGNARAGAASRVRRTIVPHPQRWRSPHDAGWSSHVAASRVPSSGADDATSPFGRPVRTFRKLLVHSATPADGACWIAAKRAEFDIYAVRNGWAEEASLAAGEVVDFLPHEQRSEIFVVTSATDWSTPVGAARMIWGAPSIPLREQFIANVLHDIDDEWEWMLEHIGAPRLAEWASLGAVGSNLSPMFAMWAAAYAASRARGVDYWMQTVVEHLFSVYRDGFGAPMLRIGKSASFFGVDWVPAILSLEEIGLGHMLSWNPELKRAMFDGWVDRRFPPSPFGWNH